MKTDYFSGTFVSSSDRIFQKPTYFLKNLRHIGPDTRLTAPYRFAFQGQEKDDEMHGATGTSYNYTFRMHDARIGRFLSIDPLSDKYPYNSPYAFSENRVVDKVELEGLETGDLPLPGYSTTLRIPTSDELSRTFGPDAKEHVYDLLRQESSAETFGITHDKRGQDRLAEVLLGTTLKETPQPDRMTYSGKVVQLRSQLADAAMATDENPQGLIEGTHSDIYSVPLENIPIDAGEVINPGMDGDLLPEMPIAEGKSIVYSMRVVTHVEQ
ncbi:MAG: hypothetical protein M3R08_04670 [Bacteroidota bacterium]|nr:hypothetical protein [Bacteroidota bacterium]